MIDVERYLRRGIRDIKPYVPGKSEEEIQQVYGLSEVIKLASNEAACPPPGPVREAIAREATRVHRYPDGRCRRLAPRLAEYLRVRPDELIFGNGAEELIFLVCQTFLNAGEEAVLVANCFDAYETAVRVMGGVPAFSPLDPDFRVNLEDISRRVTLKTKLVFLPNPNNPTGTLFTETEFNAFLESIPERVIIVLDEAYHEYVTHPGYPDGVRFIDHERPLIVLRTFSKAFGLAGLRIGYAVARSDFIRFMHHARQPFNVNRIAEAAALAALENADQMRARVQAMVEEKTRLCGALETMGLFHVPSHTNFILVDTKRNADVLFKRLLEKGVIVRPGTIWGFDTFLRITVGTREENDRALHVLEETLKAWDSS